MFATVAIVKHVETVGGDNRFYAEAEVTLTEDMEHAELQLKDVPSGVRAIPMVHAEN